MSRSHACAISTSARFVRAGKTCSDGNRPLTCPDIYYSVCWPTGFKLIISVIWTVRAGAFSTVLYRLRPPANARWRAPG